ncbi:hypothetical protein BUE93_03295 [Chromobacterium amazonense]|uniref:O-antigen ligase-related domain-containing protein n=1 Tax=Chromobacterium amazonense TaxID=1382803 RepID=A0A2S9X8W2_9NEIS|nr:O-antigen ligase family protein [Chromobacterium amazonense]PRP72170.1 hypothetical protein BUE93_03295 [Chromobacterium amazonense]
MRALTKHVSYGLQAIIPLILMLGCCMMLVMPASGRTLFYNISALAFLAFPVLAVRRALVMPDRCAWLLLAPCLVFVLLRGLWLALQTPPLDPALQQVVYSYQYSVKIWLCGIPLWLLMLCHNQRPVIPEWLMPVVAVVISLLLCGMTLQAWHEAHGGRVALGTLYATGFAYLLAAMHALALLLLYPLRMRSWHWLALLLLVGLQLLSIIATGTRAAMLVYLLYVGCLFHWRLGRRYGWKVYALAVLVLLSVSWLGRGMLEGRIQEARADLQAYHQGNAGTSLGIRFSLWDGGWRAASVHPWGQSIGSRDQLFNKLVKEGSLNRAALEMRNVHLHNEWLEILSLQGVPGALSWLAVLMGWAWFGYRRGGFAGRFMLLYIGFWFLFGLSDVMLLSPQIVMFSMMFAALGIYLSNTVDVPKNSQSHWPHKLK